MSYTDSSQEGNSDSALRGTGYFHPVAREVTKTVGTANRLSRKFATSPFGYFQGKSVNELVPTTNGLPNEVGQALGGVANSMFSKASAGGSMRGQNSPENTQGVVGSALQNMGQFLTPYILDFKKYMTQLPDQLMSSRLGYLQNTIGASAPLLGSSSTYNGSSFGVSYGGGSNNGKS